MRRAWVIMTVVVLLILASGAGVFFWQRSKKEAIVSPEASGGETSKATPQTLLIWNDPAGFTFQYKDGLTIDKHDEDQESYAHVEFTHPDHAGSIVVWAKDLPAQAGTTGASWLKTQPSYKSATTLDSTLGGLEAVKARTKDAMVVATVDENIVFYIEADLKDSDFWTPVFDSIANSFALVPVNQPAAAAGASEDIEESVDEEEIIE